MNIIKVLAQNGQLHCWYHVRYEVILMSTLVVANSYLAPFTVFLGLFCKLSLVLKLITQAAFPSPSSTYSPFCFLTNFSYARNSRGSPVYSRPAQIQGPFYPLLITRDAPILVLMPILSTRTSVRRKIPFDWQCPWKAWRLISGY